ncbi:MAG: bifunctional oligoribonuclease/PAP phosphatase NrnA, partial [Chrysiogenales bacterium]
MKVRVAEKIRQANNIAISSHVRPDADSIGSGLALFLMLRQMGKTPAF